MGVGWAVEHGGIPLEYAAVVLADHPVYVEDSGVPDPTPTERWAWAAEDLTDWEEIVVRMDWPGDDAFDEQRWDQGADWQLRESLLHIIGRTDDPEPTTELLLRHCREQIAACDGAVDRRIAEHERELDDGPDARATEEGT